MSVFYFLIGFVSTKRLLDFFRRRSFEPLFHFRSEDFQRLVSYTEFILHHPPFRFFRNHCLVKSMVLFCFLKPAHRVLEIVIGVRKDAAGGGIEGHSWLMLQGRPLCDRLENIGGYQPMWSYR